MSAAGSAYLFDVVRSPRGKARADGGLASLKPQELVRQLSASLDARLGDAVCKRAEALLLGCVGQIGAQGGNIALVSKLHAGLPDTAAAYTLNNYCVSALTAIGQAAAMVKSGQARTVLAGGVEMMSRVPFMADAADYYTDATLPSRSRYIPVVLAADRLADDARGWRHARGGRVHSAADLCRQSRGDAAGLCGARKLIRRCAGTAYRSSPHDRACAADLRWCLARAHRQR